VIERDERDIEQIMGEGDPVDRAIVAAHAEAVRRHRRSGVPMVIWRDGRVVELSAEEIPITGERDGQR